MAPPAGDDEPSHYMQEAGECNRGASCGTSGPPAVRLLELGPLQNAAGPGGYFPVSCASVRVGVHREFECEKPIDGGAQARDGQGGRRDSDTTLSRSTRHGGGGTHTTSWRPMPARLPPQGKVVPAGSECSHGRSEKENARAACTRCEVPLLATASSAAASIRGRLVRRIRAA